MGLGAGPYCVASRPPQGGEATPRQSPSHSTSNPKPTLHQRARSAEDLGQTQPKRTAGLPRCSKKASVSTLLDYRKRLLKRARCFKRLFRDYCLGLRPLLSLLTWLALSPCHLTPARGYSRQGKD